MSLFYHSRSRESVPASIVLFCFFLNYYYFCDVKNVATCNIASLPFPVYKAELSVL